MEDETCRFITVERICKTINAKNASDEHVTDVVRTMIWWLINSCPVRHLYRVLHLVEDSLLLILQ